MLSSFTNKSSDYSRLYPYPNPRQGGALGETPVEFARRHGQHAFADRVEGWENEAKEAAAGEQAPEPESTEDAVDLDVTR